MVEINNLPEPLQELSLVLAGDIQVDRYTQEKKITRVQNQLKKMEVGGVLVSRKVGRTRLFTFNPRYPFLKELQNLLEKALTFYPAEMQEKLLMNRRRPRRSGKPYETDQ